MLAQWRDMFAAGGYPWVDRNAEKVIDWMSAAKVIHVEYAAVR